MPDDPPKVVHLFPRLEVLEPDDEPAAPAPSTAPTESPRPTSGFSAEYVESLLGIPRAQLTRWARAGVVVPSESDGRRRLYGFQDLVALRAAKELLDNGLPPQKLNRAVQALRRRLPGHPAPLAELRLVGDGGDVIVCEEATRYEAESGQLLLDFDADVLGRRVVELISPRARQVDGDRKKAFDAYLEGCRHESEPRGLPRAEAAYRRAIELDPELACAYTNLGNLRYRAGAIEDARALYRKAIELEPDQPEGQYNLAFLTYEDGDLEQAIELFERALSLDGDFADAHFNLGMALVEAGRDDEAASHFAAYLALEPDGPWADLAREELEDRRR